MPDLRSKTAIVTGATSGIGEVCARELAGMGATVVLAGRSQQKLEATLARIKQKYPDADVVKGPLMDFGDPASVRGFAAEYKRQGRPLHMLVNNAGAYTTTKHQTKEGVAELCQVNHLGPYLLTRLLEGVLVASAPSRVVIVSSVTHRWGNLCSTPDQLRQEFLQGDFGHYYWNTKLANCMFGYELQRRLGGRGVQSCVVDPGAVKTDVWRHSHWLVQRAVDYVYAPPDVGAEALIYGAAAPWDTAGDRVGDGGRAALPPDQDLRYYAPVVFASPLLTWYSPEGNQGTLGHAAMRWVGLPCSTPWGVAKCWACMAAAVTMSTIDWPLRQLSRGRVQGVRLVPSSALSYDRQLGAALWDASADEAGVPRACQLA
ncbi:hypothetical protein COHA_008599 [Chlorella ohadii]|uniref:Uncharacterized protein n=1 Tax=Chlorella ohadii TaxID=2649997 RepID=A0AAD5DK03_9CHLO|nr:hypothetical protein COHA_008599 [Chlorella ohadii]